MKLKRSCQPRLPGAGQFLFVPTRFTSSQWYIMSPVDHRHIQYREKSMKPNIGTDNTLPSIARQQSAIVQVYKSYNLCHWITWGIRLSVVLLPILCKRYKMPWMSALQSHPWPTCHEIVATASFEVLDLQAEISKCAYSLLMSLYQGIPIIIACALLLLDRSGDLDNSKYSKNPISGTVYDWESHVNGRVLVERNFKIPYNIQFISEIVM